MPSYPVRPVALGRPVDSLRTSYFGVTEATYPSHFILAPHGHEAATLTFVLRGQLEEELRGRREQFGPRGLLLKPGGMVHSNRFGEGGARLLLVEVLPALHQASPSISKALSRVNHRSDPRVTGVMLRVRRELRQRDDFAGVCAEGLILELLTLLARGTAPLGGRPERYLHQVRERLDAEFCRPLRIAQLAAAEGVSPIRLSRQFRTWFGCGIGEYLRRVRLDWVADRLLRTDTPITSLAAEAGFADQSHLTRDFRTAFGITPGAYRRAGAPESN
jgi:AraC-like DNA-binding protein